MQLTRRALFASLAAVPLVAPPAAALLIPRRRVMREDHSRYPEAERIIRYWPWEYKPSELQRAFHFTRNPDGELPHVKTFQGERGCGKTTALIYEAIFLARDNPGLRGILIAPDRLSRKFLHEAFLNVLHREHMMYAWQITHSFSSMIIDLLDPRATGRVELLFAGQRPMRDRVAWCGYDDLLPTDGEWPRIRAADVPRPQVFAVLSPLAVNVFGTAY